MLPALAHADNLDPVDLIRQSDRADSTKALYCGVIERYLETGQELTDPWGLAKFAGGLPNSTRGIFRAAVGLWAGELVDRMERVVTPENLAQVQAASMRLQALKRAIKVKQPKGKRAHTWLTADQVRDLYDACGDGVMGLRDRIVLGLMVNCGLRRGETVGLKWDHIVMQPFEEGLSAVLNVIKGKGGKDRAVPIAPAFLGLLLEWADVCGGRAGYVVRAIRGTKIKDSASPMVPTGIVKRRGADIGLPELAPHDLRRTFAQAVWKATHDLIVVQELLGHKDVNTTRRYLCVDQASKIQAVQAIKWGT